MDGLRMIRRYKNLLISAHLFKNRTTFLPESIHEKVIPNSCISSVLQPFHHIFPNYARLYLKTSIRNLKFSEVYIFVEARLIGLELRRKRDMSHSVAEQHKFEISWINNNHNSKLKTKFMS